MIIVFELVCPSPLSVQDHRPWIQPLFVIVSYSVAVWSCFMWVGIRWALESSVTLVVPMQRD